MLDVLPYVTSLNLRNNRLTDVAIKKIVHSVCTKAGCGRLLTLDLSLNDLDHVSVNALADFLKTKQCKLEKLLLSRADLDDPEVVAFMEVLPTHDAFPSPPPPPTRTHHHRRHQSPGTGTQPDYEAS